MRFGKIQYLNLLVFDVFIKAAPLPQASKAAYRLRKSYPARLNQEFLFRRIDAGFISSIAAYNPHRIRKTCKAGIIAKDKVWSVLVLHDEAGCEWDYQSATSNALCRILGLSGRVLIGDRALQLYYARGGLVGMTDMAQAWHDRQGLPFVFGRLCANVNLDFYRRLVSVFNRRLGRGNPRFKGVKVPHYLLTAAANRLGLSKTFARAYLDNIYYTIGAREEVSVFRFYRLLRMRRIVAPKRFG